MQRLHQIHQNLTYEYTKVEIEKLIEEQIGIIYLNSPSDLNALSEKLKQDLAQAITTFDNDNQIKVLIILSKVEKAFCAGANIKELKNLTFESQKTGDIFYNFTTLFQDIKKPLIIGVNGAVLGGGFEFTLFGDVIVASEDTKLGLPELKLGLIPGIGGTQHLTRLIGRTNAMKYILSSDTISAKEALDLGIVNSVVKKEQLREECIRLGKKFSEKSLYTLIVAKQTIKYAEDLPLSVGIGVERQMFNSLLNTKGGQEGLKAFIEKRKPNFRDI